VIGYIDEEMARLRAPNYCSPLVHRQCEPKKLSCKNRSSHMFFVCWGECHISVFSPYRIFRSIIVLFPFTVYPPFNLPPLSVYILSWTICCAVIPLLMVSYEHPTPSCDSCQRTYTSTQTGPQNI
jgi:hypothetical protein